VGSGKASVLENGGGCSTSVWLFDGDDGDAGDERSPSSASDSATYLNVSLDLGLWHANMEEYTPMWSSMISAGHI
jgi:hypothetical protein